MKRRGVHSNQEMRERPNGSIVTKEKFETPEELLFKASELFGQLHVDRSLPIAQKALDRFEGGYPNDPRALYPILLLLGQIHLARGENDLSRKHYLKATELDPEGRETGAAPFLWSAQLSEEGGEDSIRWFEKGCGILRRELEGLEGKFGIEEAEDEILKTRSQLGEALCSMTEVYMTDLSYASSVDYSAFNANECKYSFDPDAGSKCDALMTEAVLVSPESPAVLQTLASVRISEVRVEDAKSALARSMELWQHLPADDVNIPDFATRVSLTRLLLEVEMEADAIGVVDRLMLEDDQSVEALYLAAWSRFLLYEKGADTASESRDWFRRCLRLYTSLDYEDEKMRRHVVEMIARLDGILGPPAREEEDDAEWEDEETMEEDEDIEVEDDQADISLNEVVNGEVT